MPILKPKILVQLDSDSQPSVFDGVVAVDAGVDQLFRHGGVAPGVVRDLVYGAMFTRGVEDLRHTAIFVGGSNVAAGEALFAAVCQTFFGPMRVSVMLDSNGANTTAAAAVLAAGKHLPLAGAEVLVLAATGPVGSRVVRLLAGEGAHVRAASRDQTRAESTCTPSPSACRKPNCGRWRSIRPTRSAKRLTARRWSSRPAHRASNCLAADVRRQAASLKVAIDLSAVPPLGNRRHRSHRQGQTAGRPDLLRALGVGGTKMKIHKAAIAQLFAVNDQVLDAEEIYQIGRKLAK